MDLLAAAYIALLHLAVAFLLLKGSRAEDLWRRFGFDHPYYLSRVRRAHHVLRRVDASAPAGAVVFLGDSLIAQMAVAAIAPRAVNFGTPGQRSDHLLSQMPFYRCMSRASAVVLMIGTNNIVTGRQGELPAHYRELLQAIPSGVPVVMVGIPPLRDHPAESLEAARAAKVASDGDGRCTFVDAHAALSFKGSIQDDGVHISDAGYRVLIEMLRHAMGSVGRVDAEQNFNLDHLAVGGRVLRDGAGLVDADRAEIQLD